MSLKLLHRRRTLNLQVGSRPNAVTDLTVGEIYATALQLNFTQPASENSIDFYEVRNNGSKIGEVKQPGDYIINLTPSTTYNLTVLAVDTNSLKSDPSNAVQSTTNLNAVPTNALVSYYKLDGNLTDSHGTNHGTNNGTTAVVDGGIIGDAMYFDGVNDSASLPIDLSTFNSFSLDWWFKTSQTEAAANYMIQHVGNGTSGASFMVSHENGKIAIRVFGAVVYQETGFNDNQLHHIAINVPENATTTNIEVFVDTVKLKIGTNSGTPLNLSPNTLKLGGVTTDFNGLQSFEGVLDEMSIYSRTRNLGEISDRFNNGNGITLNEA